MDVISSASGEWADDEEDPRLQGRGTVLDAALLAGRYLVSSHCILVSSLP